jgi:MFS family permease
VIWKKIVLFSSTLFLIRLADGIISFWAPNQIQNFLNNPILMGMVISFQSVVGFFADLIFPHLLKTTKVRKMIFWAIAASFFTSLFLVSAAIKPFIAIFLVTMTLWGIYYELISFANYQFMGSVVPTNMRSGAWGVMGIFTNFAYFLGPLIAAELLLKSYLATEITIVVFLGVSLIFLLLTKKSHDAPVQIDVREINPLRELGHWLTLAKYLWPAIIMSLLFGFIDSTYWTIGAVWTEKLSRESALGGFFLPFYQLPPLFMGLVVAKWGVYRGKKVLVEKFLIVAGILLLAISFNAGIPWQLSMVLLSSAALSICYPLLEGVYTDVVARMGQQKNHLIGLTSSTINLAYVVWPPIAGAIAGRVGERLTFSVVGGMVIVVSFVLLFVTPKKLRLPQEEIRNWRE